jgi:flavin-dependent dehydrogenase
MDMPNVRRRAAVPGIGFVGDAAQASDPLWGVGCGFALSASEWLAEEVGPALAAGGDVDAGLERYHARFRSMLAGHHFLMSDYASGRRFRLFEKLVFQAAVRDQEVANTVTEFGYRGAPVRHTLTPAFLARATGAVVRR